MKILFFFVHNRGNYTTPTIFITTGLTVLVAITALPTSQGSGKEIRITDTIYIQEGPSSSHAVPTATPTNPDLTASNHSSHPHGATNADTTPLAVLKHCISVQVTESTAAPSLSHRSAASHPSQIPGSQLPTPLEQSLAISVSGSNAPPAMLPPPPPPEGEPHEYIATAELQRLRRQVVSPDNIAAQDEIRELRTKAIQGVSDAARIKELEGAVNGAMTQRDNARRELEGVREDQVKVAYWQNKVRDLVEDNEGLRQDAQRIREHLLQHDVAQRGAAAEPVASPPKAAGLAELAHAVEDLAASASTAADLTQQRERLRNDLAAERQRSASLLTEITAMRRSLHDAEKQVVLLQEALHTEQRAFSSFREEAGAATRRDTLRAQESGAAYAELQEKLAAESSKKSEAEATARLLHTRLREVEKSLAQVQMQAKDKEAAMTRQLLQVQQGQIAS